MYCTDNLKSNCSLVSFRGQFAFGGSIFVKCVIKHETADKCLYFNIIFVITGLLHRLSLNTMGHIRIVCTYNCNKLKSA